MPLGQQVRETNRQRFSLSGPRPCDNKHWAVTSKHGFPLPVIEALEPTIGLDVHGRITLPREPATNEPCQNNDVCEACDCRSS